MNAIVVPIPKIDVNVRGATPADLPFIDSLQKLHSDRVGFLKRVALEAKIAAGQVLIAEDSKGEGVGYCIGQDRYFKRDDVGIIFQLNVSPGSQRSFVGATLLKAMFNRAAYGCRLFCCWCAQDIAANRFWEAMGFVPLAYRAGSEKKARVHIFWQKRIREGDGGQGGTPWWYPSQTNAGMLGEDRLVLPIPPGTHWSDAKPVILPALSAVEGPGAGQDAPKPLPAPRGPRERKAKAAAPLTTVSRRLSFAPVAPPVPAKAEKKPRERKPKAKNDPKLVAAARELRDRWLEQVNAGAYVFEEAGKYDVSRALPGATPSAAAAPQLPHIPAMLPAA